MLESNRWTTYLMLHMMTVSVVHLLVRVLHWLGLILLRCILLVVMELVLDNSCYQ